MTAAQKLNAYSAIVEKHYNAIKAESGVRFVTRADHEAMAKEAKRRANAEIAAS